MTKMARHQPMVVDPRRERLRAKILAYSELKENGCREWQRARSKNGYGFIHFDGKMQKAHRLAFEAFIRPIPPGRFVLHHCDNPSCVRPSHLYAGTNNENMRDMVRKNRAVHGERQHLAKLTHAAVVEIIASKLTAVALAEKFSVDAETVRRVRRGETWRRSTGIRKP